MRFIDANIIVKAFTKDKDSERCRKLLGENAVTDALCLIEANHAIARITQDRVHASRSIKSLFRGGILIADVDKNILFQALKKFETQKLSTFDVIHYSIALNNNCAEIVSYDKDFDKLDIRRIEP